MKKSLLFALTVATLAGLNSCGTDNGTVSTTSFSCKTLNLVTALDGSAAPSVASSSYSFNFDLIAGTCVIGGEVTNSISPISFATESLKYTVKNWQWQEAIHEVVDIESFKPANNIYNLDFQVTTMANIPPVVEGLPAISIPSGYKYVVANYQVGDNVNVRTFWPDVTFTGNTTTSYSFGGVDKNFTSSDVKYRVILNATDKKATVILYDARFAEEMPKPITNVVLNDLPVTFSNAGYEINATNITPVTYEGGVATPNTDRVFNSFSLSVSGDLTDAYVSYKVANVFNGSFQGSYIAKPGTSSAE